MGQLECSKCGKTVTGNGSIVQGRIVCEPCLDPDAVGSLVGAFRLKAGDCFHSPESDEGELQAMLDYGIGPNDLDGRVRGPDDPPIEGTARGICVLTVGPWDPEFTHPTAWFHALGPEVNVRRTRRGEVGDWY